MSLINPIPPIEPLMSNRYVIKTIGKQIPEYLFRKYKIYNDGKTLFFDTEFFETTDFSFNPTDFFKIKGFKIEYVNGTGEIMSTLSFKVKGISVVTKDSYKSKKFCTYKMKFGIQEEIIKGNK